MTAQTGRTLIVVFDGARARFFKREPDGRFVETMAECSSGLPHATDGKQIFVSAIAAALDGALDRNEYDRLAIVAPQQALGGFRAALSDKVRACIRREIPKELADLSDGELQKHLDPYFGSPAAT